MENGKRQALTLNGDYVTLERPEGVLLFAGHQTHAEAGFKKRFGQGVWDIGDGVLCLEFTSPNPKPQTPNPKPQTPMSNTKVFGRNLVKRESSLTWQKAW